MLWIFCQYLRWQVSLNERHEHGITITTRYCFAMDFNIAWNIQKSHVCPYCKCFQSWSLMFVFVNFIGVIGICGTCYFNSQNQSSPISTQSSIHVRLKNKCLRKISLITRTVRPYFPRGRHFFAMSSSSHKPDTHENEPYTHLYLASVFFLFLAMSPF